jgi:hypothetical protein
MVTGESMPVEKARGQGDRGHDQRDRRARDHRGEIGADTMLSRIVHMVADAQRSRAPIQRLADSVAAWFVPAVMALGGPGVCCLDDLGTRSGAGSGGGCRRVRAHHRVPVRARARNPDVHHGRRGQRAPAPASSSRTPKRSSGSRRSIPWWSIRPARSRRANPVSRRSCRPQALTNPPSSRSARAWKNPANIRSPPLF